MDYFTPYTHQGETYFLPEHLMFATTGDYPFEECLDGTEIPESKVYFANFVQQYHLVSRELFSKAELQDREGRFSLGLYLTDQIPLSTLYKDFSDTEILLKPISYLRFSGLLTTAPQIVADIKDPILSRHIKGMRAADSLPLVDYNPFLHPPLGDILKYRVIWLHITRDSATEQLAFALVDAS